MSRPRIKLTEAEIAQAQEMLKSGKDVDEVVDFMKQTYDVSVKPSFIKSLKKKVAVDDTPREKKHYKKRGLGKPTSLPSPRIQESAGSGDCRLKPICVHAEICVVEICRFRKE